MTDNRTLFSDITCQVFILERWLRDAPALISCVASGAEYPLGTMTRGVTEGVTRCRTLYPTGLQIRFAASGRGRFQARVIM